MYKKIICHTLNLYKVVLVLLLLLIATGLVITRELVLGVVTLIGILGLIVNIRGNSCNIINWFNDTYFRVLEMNEHV